MTHFSQRNPRATKRQNPTTQDLPTLASPLDQHAPADLKRDRRLIADLTGNFEVERIARLRKETSATESEADGILVDHDQIEEEAAHASIGIAPDPIESEIMD